MLAARITLTHRSVCSAVSFPKSVGEPASVVPPRSATREGIAHDASHGRDFADKIEVELVVERLVNRIE
jgi:hypothetical protein